MRNAEKSYYQLVSMMYTIRAIIVIQSSTIDYH